MGDPRAKKRKIHDDSMLEGPQTSYAAPFDNLSDRSNIAWMAMPDEQIENDQDYPITPVPYVEEEKDKTLALPSDGLELDGSEMNSLVDGFISLNSQPISNIEFNINDPVLGEWASGGDYLGDGQRSNEPQPYDMQAEYPIYYPDPYLENPTFQPQYPSPDDLAAYDQPGPSHSSYSHPQPPPCNQIPEISQNDWTAPKGTEDRVRDNAGLLTYWKDPVWKSKEWRKLLLLYGKEKGIIFPEPPPPSILYERKKNGRKMNPENELDPYLHLVDQDALTLIEGSNRGNFMIPKNLDKYKEARTEEQKREAVKNLWKDILGRVINNRQSADIKNRSLVGYEQFTRGVAQLCQATREYRSLLERVLNRRILELEARQEMNRLEQIVLLQNNQAPSLLEWVEDFAKSEAKKKPTPRKKTPRGRK